MGRTYIVVDARNALVFTDWRAEPADGGDMVWTAGTAPFYVYGRDDAASGFGLIDVTNEMRFLDTGAAPDTTRPWSGSGRAGAPILQPARDPVRRADA